jgi:hypothetical protein
LLFFSNPFAKRYRGFSFDFRRSALASQYKRGFERLRGTSRTDAVLGAGVILVHELAKTRLLGLSHVAKTAVDGTIIGYKNP